MPLAAASMPRVPRPATLDIEISPSSASSLCML